MKRLTLSLFVVFVLIMTLAGGCVRAAAGGPATPGVGTAQPLVSLDDPQTLERFLDAAIAERMERYHIPAEVVAVVRDGQVVLAKGYGYADLEKRIPVDPDRTLFRIGSVSKLFVWTAVMQLAEQGKLDLDQDVNTYLTAADGRRRIWIPDTYPEPITLAHLLTHTSGFEKQDWYSLFPDKVSWIPLEEYLATRMPERVHPPGRFWVYSNYGTSLAAYIVEQASGMPFEAYVERFIYAPLEMKHSTFRQPLPPTLSGDMATGIVWQTGKSRGLPSEFEWIYPAGSMSSTANDMARFMIAHLRNGRWADRQILGEQTAVDMHSQHFTYDPRLPGFAYGFFEDTMGGARLLYHAGGTAAFSAHLALIPEHNLGLFEAYSGGQAGSGFVYTRFVERFLPAPAAPSLSPSSRVPTKQYAGEYLDLNVNHSSPEKLLALVKGVRVRRTEEGALAFLGGTWKPVAPLTFQEVNSGDLAVFRTEDGTPDGRVTHMVRGELAYEKLPWNRRTVLHCALLAGCLLIFLSAVLGWPVASLLRRRRSRKLPLSAYLARWAGWTMSVTFLGFVLSFARGVYENGVLLYGLTAAAKAILTLPLVGAGLAVVTAILTGAAWKGWNTPAGHPPRSLLGQAHMTLVALAGIGFAAFANYWNLLGL